MRYDHDLMISCYHRHTIHIMATCHGDEDKNIIIVIRI